MRIATLIPLAAAAALLCACAPDVGTAEALAQAEREAAPLSAQSSRVWRGWRVDCMADSSWADSRVLYAFAPATEADAALARDGFGDSEQVGEPGGQGAYFISDPSLSCRGRGFFAQRGPGGDLMPATQGFSYASAGSPSALSTRAWRGWRVDCQHDSKFLSPGRDYYQFRKLAPGEEGLPSDGLSEPKPSGRLGKTILYWVHDSSLACSNRGFYAARSGGELVPAGIALSFSSGKSTGAAGQIFMDAGEPQLPDPPAPRP